MQTEDSPHKFVTLKKIANTKLLRITKKLKQKIK